GTPYVSTFGTLTLNADGSYSYTPKATVPAGSVDVFTYTLIDADGDPDTAELKFTFAGDNSKATATSAAAATSDVAGDTDPGSNVNAFTPQVSSGTLAIAYGSDGFGSFNASYDGTL
ncbi:Ig-like domain-containing protein, partial [Tsuneonella sp. HG222]